MMKRGARTYKVIGIVGSRRRANDKDDSKLLAKFLEVFERGDRIVSGGCPIGADAMAERIAKRHQVPITIHYAWWNGPAKKAAGFLRNSDIATDCDILIALPAPDRTGGTEDTISKVKKLGKKVILVK